MALHRRVLQEDDILCEVYVDIYSDVSDNSDNEILDRNSDIPTTSSHKLGPSAIAVTSDSETSTEEEECSEPDSSDDNTSDVWCKTDKKPSNEP